MKKCAICSFESEDEEAFARHAATHGLGRYAAPAPKPQPASRDVAPRPQTPASPAAPQVAPASSDFVAKGYNGQLTVKDRSVVISHKGALAFIVGQGNRGEKEIPLDEITAVQLKRAGMMAGYIQIIYHGSLESKGGVLAASGDENSINYYKKSQAEFDWAKQLIEERRELLKSRSAPSSAPSSTDELARLAGLHKDGALTDEEFAAAKRRVLGL